MVKTEKSAQFRVGEVPVGSILIFGDAQIPLKHSVGYATGSLCASAILIELTTDGRTEGRSKYRAIVVSCG